MFMPPLPISSGSVRPGYLKFADTDIALVMVTETVRDVLTTSPVQPTHGEPAAGFAVRVTTVPAGNDVPEGLMETVPLPTVFTDSV